LQAPAGRFAHVRAGAQVDCGITTDGGLACWGDGSQRCLQSAGGTPICATVRETGLLSPPPGVFIDVSVNAYAACAVDEHGGPGCWGNVARQPL
jgi:hypothetical protein